MGSPSQREDPNHLRGQHIVGEKELSFTSDTQTKERRRRRQNITFLGFTGLLAIVFVLAALVFTGRLEFPGEQPPAVAQAEPAIENPACPAAEFNYLSPDQVQVRVLNTTGQNGLAGRTAQLLEKRGFSITSTTSAASDYSDEVGAVVAGALGYAQALTLQRHLEGSVFVFDESIADDRVDFEVGAKFTALTKTRRMQTGPGQLVCADQTGQGAAEDS